MAMERSKRIADLWNWLPAFRVVAEYESVQKAAATLRLSPSALSRSVKLHEEAVGEALFTRSTTGLSLTACGADLLGATRDAMRRIDDALSATAGSSKGVETFRVAASGPVLPSLAASALGRLARRAPARLRYLLVDIDETAVVEELLRGDIDVALLEGWAANDARSEVVAETVGELAFSLHAHEGHPLAKAGAAVTEDVGAVAFSFDVDPVNRHPVAAVAPSLAAAVTLAVEAQLLAYLPEGLAPASFRPLGPPTWSVMIHAVSRRPLAEQDSSTRAFVDAVRTVIGEGARPEVS